MTPPDPHPQTAATRQAYWRANLRLMAWLLAIYFVGGLISLIMALRYRQPITGAYSIPGAAIMIGALATIPFTEAVGAFIMSGAIVLLLGVSGVIGRIMSWLPMPIVMAMNICV